MYNARSYLFRNEINKGYCSFNVSFEYIPCHFMSRLTFESSGRVMLMHKHNLIFQLI